MLQKRLLIDYTKTVFTIKKVKFIEDTNRPIPVLSLIPLKALVSKCERKEIKLKHTALDMGPITRLANVGLGLPSAAWEV